MTLFKATNSHQLSIVIIPVIMVMLATVCVILRFRARRLRKQSAMFDDWFCLVALVSLFLYVSNHSGLDVSVALDLGISRSQHGCCICRRGGSSDCHRHGDRSERHYGLLEGKLQFVFLSWREYSYLHDLRMCTCEC